MEIISLSCLKRTMSFATEPYMFFILFCVGSHNAILPQLILYKVCLQNYNSTLCDNLDSGQYNSQEGLVHANAAVWNMYFFLAGSIPSIFTAILIGYAYDFVVRSHTLYIHPFTMSLQAIVYAISSRYIHLHVGVLLLGSAINSICGDTQGSIVIAYAYMADITSKDTRRSWRMAILESTIFFGQAAGSLISGLVLQKFGFESVFWISLAINILNFFYVTFLLYNGSNKVQAVQKRDFSYGNINFLLRNFLQQRSFLVIIFVLSASFLTNMAAFGESEILSLYAKRQPLGLSPKEIGYYFSILHFLRGVGGVLNAILVTKVWNPSDYIIAMVGLVSYTATHIAISFAHTRTALYLTSCLSCTSPLAMSSLRSIATKVVAEKYHGLVLSLVAMCSGVSFALSTTITNEVYKLTSNYSPGAAIRILACFSGTALLITLGMYIWQRLSEKDDVLEKTGEEEVKSEDGSPLLTNKES